MPSRPGANSRLDSWPPTQVRLAPTTPKDYPSLEDIDADPLTYFLTPAPDLEDMEDADMMDFDAGIESPGRSNDIVRSVSPSSLEGLAKPKSRMASPPVPELYDTTMPDTDEEEEDYVRFAPPHIGLPKLLWGPKETGIMTRSKTRSTSGPSMRLTAEALLSVSAPRGRSRASGRGRDTASASLRRRGSHLWRSPSPDVWSIEEETEEEMLSELGSSVGPRSTTDGDRPEKTLVDGKAAKPKKRVRFVLPGEEM